MLLLLEHTLSSLVRCYRTQRTWLIIDYYGEAEHVAKTPPPTHKGYLEGFEHTSLHGQPTTHNLYTHEDTHAKSRTNKDTMCIHNKW